MRSAEEDILKILRKSPISLTIEEIAAKAKLTRQTTSKYLFYLEGKGAVKRRNVGTAKLYYLEGRAR